MRLVHASLLALAALAPLAACSSAGAAQDDGPGVPASGTGGERHYAVAGFDEVALGDTGDVEVRTGQAFGLTVTGAPADLDTLKVTRRGTTLGLGHKRGNWNRTGRIRWVVTLPRLIGASIGGSGAVRVDQVDGPSFKGSVGGSGSLSVARMRVDDAAFSIGGSGSVAATGTARSLSLSLGGSGALRLAGLVAQTAKVSMAGSGSIGATVRQRAEISSVGSGDVTITGGAHCSVSRMGSGNVRCG